MNDLSEIDPGRKSESQMCDIFLIHRLCERIPSRHVDFINRIAIVAPKNVVDEMSSQETRISQPIFELFKLNNISPPNFNLDTKFADDAARDAELLDANSIDEALHLLNIFSSPPDKQIDALLSMLY